MTERRQRQAHRKSRRGCARCKSGHRKCDEVHPVCGACRRLGIPCSFEWSMSPVSGGAAATALRPSSADARLDENNGHQASLALDDLRLLHHWLRGEGSMFEDHAGETSRRERDRQLELALAHPYLMHAILSIAALELFHRGEPQTSHPPHCYYTLAAWHNVQALSHARPNMARSNCDSHSEPLFIFSALTSLYAFAEPPLRRSLSSFRSEICNGNGNGNGNGNDCLRDLLSAFYVARGIPVVIEANKAGLERVDQPNQGETWSDETPEVLPTLDADFPQLQLVLDLVETHFCCTAAAAENNNNNDDDNDDDDNDRYAHYKPALRDAATRLFAIISLLLRRPENHSSAWLIQAWPMHVDPCLLELWEAKHPVAMVILAYYAVLVQLRANLWFFQRWPPLILDYVGQNLVEEEWQTYLDWPRKMIFNRTE
ncbi:hypothetical protein L228DRAFT_238866 [Xylona heveae TC161]|uniref:Zn(2)-C6 fungal-type domain-containing protein n=1 Tax=Xylona heveae (strain CBS 132557 / TC161) TaxID=1328760 RepID=A0A165H4L5_XYLHT|nr:hypothetical protein L228DRAFT_238866 [Xylona heveae TC161]KZF22976.1 hypothetical protein L228DRAFT_238866 [Xylona heveae TC161]